ncbi:shikimate dehydrogenase [Histidinibacterium aquaticum]|uniref:shikimate dehydrogenase n=1 Tax=Histidinibacterium aquaticum TaxID=2613962 RepID=UPI001CC3F494|nr:shikimate dehydrogenase [Histidinibacterium aquaticum]
MTTGRAQTIRSHPELRLGLIGRGIRLSRTPRMHEAEAAAQGLACSYELLDTDAGTAGSLEEIVAWAEAEGFAGLNVTYPYKQEIMPLLDDLSSAATRVGAVNTVVFREGRRSGHNTDYWGFSESLRQNLPGAEVDCVLLIGAGGAGGAIGHALADMGATRLLIADKREGAAQSLARSINGATGAEVASPVDDLSEASAQTRGIVNATPMGMAKMPGLPLEAGLIEARHWVADIVYFPLETALLRHARETGCRTLSGEGMAIFQAVRAFELFTGVKPDADRMTEAFRAQSPEQGAA